MIGYFLIRQLYYNLTRALRVISNYRVFIPTTQRELICTQQPGPKIMKLITSIKAMRLPEKGRNVIIHVETEALPVFPLAHSVSLCVCRSHYAFHQTCVSATTSIWNRFVRRTLSSDLFQVRLLQLGCSRSNKTMIVFITFTPPAARYCWPRI